MTTYIIAEIGQNHNGSYQQAKTLIKIASDCGADAIKLTKRDNDEISNELDKMPYMNEHSYGATYGEHLRALELTYKEHRELGAYAKSLGLGYIETLCSLKTLVLAQSVDKIKVASRDVVNIPLLCALSKICKPIIISLGMANYEEIKRAMLCFYNQDVSLLHCLSEYPAQPENIDLNVIRDMRYKFRGYDVGYSDHTQGYSIALAAVTLGANIIEKHITLDRKDKGSDHCCSLEPLQFKQMVEEIRKVELALKQPKRAKEIVTAINRDNLSRSLAYKDNYRIGMKIEDEMLHMVSPGTGLSWNHLHYFAGKTLSRSVEKNQLCELSQISSV